MSIYNPVIPYCGPINAVLNNGSLIRIQGSPHATPRCFAINLQCGPSVNPRDDIALHLSPVFSPPPRVVRNSLQSQRWGPEESYGGFPFMSAQPFEIMILVDSDHFKIAINGQHFTEFRHRIQINRITYISIDGDVAISQIMFEGMHAFAPSMPTAPPSAPYGAVPYPTAAVPPPYASGGVPPYPSAAAPPYSSAAVPQYAGVMPPYGAPNPGYPTQPAMYQQSQQQAYPYPHSPQPQQKSGGLGGILGGTLGGLASGAAVSSIGSAILGRSGGQHGYPGGSHKSHKSSNPIPIAGLAAGAGAAALGAAVLTGHHPFKKAKKLFKHKHKMFKHKFGKWKHKGWSSGSSSS